VPVFFWAGFVPEPWSSSGRVSWPAGFFVRLGFPPVCGAVFAAAGEALLFPPEVAFPAEEGPAEGLLFGALAAGFVLAGGRGF
jgi:hypothetical protein